MKQLIILFLGILIFTGCEKKNSVEIIPDYNSIYYASDNIDKPPRLLDGDENKLEAEIQKEMSKNSVDKIGLEYRLLLDENGKVEKILPVLTPGLSYSDLVADAVSSWKFEPGRIGDKTVKSQYTWNYFVPGEIKIDESEYKVAADSMPQPVGGMQMLSKNIVYPEKAKQNGTEGKVFLQVYIDETGKVVKTTVMKSAGGLLDSAAVTAIRKTSFTPGVVDGKHVKVKVVIPIVFKLS
jgi:TonB family protein